MVSLTSLNTLSSLTSSLSKMQTMSSMHTKIEGRANVLEAEIHSGFGNLEKKQEHLDETTDKLSSLEGMMGDMMIETTEKVNEANKEQSTTTEKTEAEKEEEAEKDKTSVSDITIYDKDGNTTVPEEQESSTYHATA